MIFANPWLNETKKKNIDDGNPLQGLRVCVRMRARGRQSRNFLEWQNRILSESHTHIYYTYAWYGDKSFNTRCVCVFKNFFMQFFYLPPVASLSHCLYSYLHFFIVSTTGDGHANQKNKVSARVDKPE